MEIDLLSQAFFDSIWKSGWEGAPIGSSSKKNEWKGKLLLLSF
jgi:hypothetical protein